jgi:hypothetical protein
MHVYQMMCGVIVGRKESVAELKVMVATLHKEMSMMQLQLNKYKEAACAVHSLRAEIQSTAAVLDRKVCCFLLFSPNFLNLVAHHFSCDFSSRCFGYSGSLSLYYLAIFYWCKLGVVAVTADC